MKTYRKFEEQLNAFANSKLSTVVGYLKMPVVLPRKMTLITKLTGNWMEPRECVDTGLSRTCGHRGE